jgi:hypothetical protein
MSLDDATLAVLDTGKPAAFGGVSLLGDSSVIIHIGVLQVQVGRLHGWHLAIGDPNRQPAAFVYIDTAIAPVDDLPFPTFKTYFVGEGDIKLMRRDISPKELTAIARFILAFINDDGPPAGIQW